jgi:alkanesulfonate monooxygenase SsuD/methylene tetrahydromethanopterin reductase-like flavin-dependent oxidoreductase (luciferase family)
MSVGIVLPTREVEMRRAGTDGGLRTLVDLAVSAEAVGLDHVWVGDSPVARPRAEPFTLLGAVAGATTTVGLGTAALIPALRHPLHTAHAIATLDQVAPGRLTVAVGAGFPYDATRDEFAAFGVPFTGRNERLDRTVALWRSHWSADTDGIPQPASPGGPPIWLAAGPSPTNAARIAALYDGWLPYPPTAEGYGAGVQATTPAERPLAHGLYVTLTLGSQETQDRYLQEYYGTDPKVVAALQACHAGDPDSAVAFLSSFVAAGARHLVIRIGDFDTSRQLRLLADEVMPALPTEVLR